MSNLVHVLLSEAGEPEAGPTEFAERIFHSEGEAERAFSEMGNACEQFIESQIEIISANKEMRDYNELMYGEVGGGYYYHVYWLAFPLAEKELSTPGDLIAHYLFDGDSIRPESREYLRRQVGHQSDEIAIEALVEQQELCR